MSMCLLYQSTCPTSMTMENLSREPTVSKMETVQNEGGRQVTRNKDFYNLGAIIAVGYRINSKRATQFRIWATGILKEYIIKGFAMDDVRLKKADTWDYFDEWLARIWGSQSETNQIVTLQPELT